MNVLSLLLSLTVTTTIASEAFAKRAGPPTVTPIVHQGVRYLAPNDNGLEGRIEARSEKTGEKLWDAVIYTVRIDRNLEEDVQWVFISSLALRGDTLVITSQRNEKYILDLKTREVEKATNGR